MNALIFIAASLACFRLTRLVTDDKIMEWARGKLVRSVPTKSKKLVKEGINCPFCVSYYWASAITTYLWWLGYSPWQEAFLWQPAIWGASILLNELLIKLYK